MEVNYVAIAVATVLQFIIGAIWYSVLFSKLWGKIHGFDKIAADQQAKMKKQMAPLLAVQFLITIVTTFVLALFASELSPAWHAYGVAGFLWLGFVLPTQISAVIFGGTEPKWIIKKILVMAGGSLACLMAAATVLYFM